MARKKNPILKEVTIDRMAAEGKCVAHHDGKVVFVKNVAPGDVADLRITKKKKKFFEARPIHFHSFSPLRADPFCSHFGTCGGCKWQHIPYEEQLKYKQQQVIDNFERIAKAEIKEVLPIIASEQTTYYRNKLEFTFSNYRWLTHEEISTGEVLDRRALGFHIPQSFDKILPIQHCYLQPDPSNKIRLAVEAFAKEENITFFDQKTHQGVLRSLIIRTSNIGQLMIIIQFGADAIIEIEQRNAIVEFLRDNFLEITSLNYIINTKKNDTYYDLEVVHCSGEKYIVEEMEDLRFRVSPKAFFQTNSDQAYQLYKAVRKLAKIRPDEVVYDLYTGTGTIANFLARSAKEVIGIEYVQDAIGDAKSNSSSNDIGNTSFYAGDIKEVLSEEFLKQNNQPQVVVADPPRNGMHPEVIEKLLSIAASRIVYVSCNPATQARDVALLSQKYEVASIQAVDMFPHTHHVENICLLELQ